MSTGSSIRRWYSPSEDRMHYVVNGDVAINSISLTVMSFEVNSLDYVLPLMENFSIELNGVLTVKQEVCMIPGFSLVINEGAEMIINSDTTSSPQKRRGFGVYLYNREEWRGDGTNYYAASGANFKAVQYSPTRKYTFKDSDLKNVHFDVNGTITVKGYGSYGGLYTSGLESDIISSKGTGKIAFVNGAGTKTVSYQCKNNTSTYGNIPIVSAKLHNGANHPTEGQYSVGEYTATADSAAGTIFYYCSTCDAWYNAQHNHTYTVTWKNYDEAVLETDENVPYGTTPSYDGATPTRATTAEYTYEFSGWTPAIADVTGDATYTATFTATYTYTFNNTWSPEVVSVTEAATYTAQFTETTRTYTVTWIDGNGNTLKTEQVAYGVTPAYTGATPTKTATAQYTYTFNNTWSPAVTTVSGDATYTAQFDSTVNTYTITWLDGNGNTLKTDEVAYGEMPDYGDTPTKDADKACSEYTFAGWTPAIESVTGAQTYTAQFTGTPREYSIKLNYQTLVNGTATDYDNKGATVKYTYPDTINAPSIRYYNLDHWTIGNSTESVSTANLPAAIRGAIDAANTDAELENITVKAFFVRKTYTVSIYSSKDNGKTKTEEAGAQNIVFSVGRSYWINASAELENGAFKFDHWLINGVRDDNQRAACWFGEADEGKAIEAIACYVASSGSTEGTAEEDDAPRVTVRDYFTEENNGVRVIGMTLEVIAPEDMTNYSIEKVGFGFTDKEGKAKTGELSEVYSNGWDNSWRSGTYIMRMKLDSADTKIYSFGFLDYLNDGSATTKRIYATYNWSGTDRGTKYDTMGSTGRE